MQFVDTGGRDPDQTLATWLTGAAEHAAEVRIASGFFSARSIPYLEAALARLDDDAAVRILIGSNNGMTSRYDVEALAAAIDGRMSNARLGVVRFADGTYFHPKVLHITQDDGSQRAYVGSANLTPQGLKTHVESGIVLDSADDDPAVLAEVAASVDAWFDESRDGLVVVDATVDYDDLIARRIIGVPQPSRPRGVAGSAPVALPVLTPIPVPPPAPVATSVIATWGKKLDRSNAQRKRAGNNRGAITLTKSSYDIEPQTWFRDEFFGDADWIAGFANTGSPRDTAAVPMTVTILGAGHGVVEMEVSDSPYRRQGDRNNATTLLHIGALKDVFADQDLTGSLLRIDRMSDGSYRLTIEPPS